jgi:hypothetical protein
VATKPIQLTFDGYEEFWLHSRSSLLMCLQVCKHNFGSCIARSVPAPVNERLRQFWTDRMYRSPDLARRGLPIAVGLRESGTLSSPTTLVRFPARDCAAQSSHKRTNRT